MSPGGCGYGLWTALMIGLAGPTLPMQRVQYAPEQLHSPATVTSGGVPTSLRLSLEETKQRALSNNKLINLATLNAESKGFAISAAKADYLPKVVGSLFYLHFHNDLGTVLTVRRPIAGIPATVEANVYNQNSTIANIMAAQPITDLLKVKQGVRIARADQQIAQAQLEKGIRELMSGVEQLYWGLLALQRIQAGAKEGLKGAEALAQSGTLGAKLAVVEAKQALQQVNKQFADLHEQLCGLIDVPPCTVLELVEPALPTMPYHCADEVVALALATNPDICEAAATIDKANAALKAGKLDYVPSVALVGGYTDQTLQSYVPQNIGYVGVVGSYTFVDWGKRKNIIREREHLVAMATLKLQQTQDDVRQKAVKTFREYGEARDALQAAEEMAKLRGEAEKAAKEPQLLMDAVKAKMTADVEVIKAELAYRQAHVQVMSLIGK